MVYSLYKDVVNVCNTSGMLSLCFTLWNVNLVLSAFKDNLSLLNQCLIFDNALFAVFKIEWISFPE